MSEEFYGFGDIDFDTTAVEWLQREYKSHRELWDRHGDIWGYQLSEPILVEMLNAYFNYRLNLDMKETGRKIDEMGNAGFYGD